MLKFNILNNKYISLEFAGNLKITCFVAFSKMEKSPNNEICDEKEK